MSLKAKVLNIVEKIENEAPLKNYASLETWFHRQNEVTTISRKGNLTWNGELSEALSKFKI